MPREDIVLAHKHSSIHREEILRSQLCGCFHCAHRFVPALIKEWTDLGENGIGQTAFCPECAIDSVIGSESGFPITPEFLKEMRGYWFS